MFKMIWEVNSLSVSISVFVILCTLWLTGKFFNEDAIYIYESYRNKKHSWRTIRLLKNSCFCSVCEIMVPSNGIFCECCGICCDIACVKKAEKLLRCKEKKLSERAKPHEHLWVHGNLPANVECYVCHEDMESQETGPGLFGFKCAWCQRCVHNGCFEMVENECDFGSLKDFIVPPSCMIVSRTRGAPKLHLTGLNPPDIPKWSPLIIISNTKSGSQEGSFIVATFRALLNPLQVMEIASHGPNDALQWSVIANPVKCKILVAGGDGTVGWVLNTIASLGIENAEVGILPLGTGNDLSRVLGWGEAAAADFEPLQLLQKVRTAVPVPLDRWEINVNKSTRIPLRTRRQQTFFMYNYFSVGVDALVTLNFHKARESAFYIFSSRVVNKLLYLFYGGHQVLQQDCSELEQKIELYLDGERLDDLPELQSVVVSNIDSWGAGVQLYNLSKHPQEEHSQSFSDGLLEIYGINSSFHIAQLQVGLSKPIRLGVAREVRIKILSPLPVQCDGEPWEQTQCDIIIKRHSQATVLKSDTPL